MGWAENLQTASFRGVEFEVLNTRESVSRDHVVYEYPNVDGGDVKDLGRKPRPYRLSAYLWGDYYEYQLQRLTTALDSPGDGELIHPIYGSVPSVVVTSYDVIHEAESPDSCTVDISFLENRKGAALFANELPELLGQSLFDRLEQLTSELGELFDAVTTPLNTATGLIKKAKTVETALINTLLTFKSDVNYSLDEIFSISQEPARFVSELSSALDIRTMRIGSAIPCLAAATTTVFGLASKAVDVASPQTVLTCWTELKSELDELVEQPESFINGDVSPEIDFPANALESDLLDTRIMYQVSAAAELASTASAILSDEDQVGLLTPYDVELLVNDVRENIQSCITALRERYQPERQLITETEYPVGLLYLDVIATLKATALDVQDLALATLLKRPPLTKKTITTDSCFLLLAHLWYADYTRATELARLNPAIRNPNKITKGMVINAYAR